MSVRCTAVVSRRVRALAAIDDWPAPHASVAVVVAGRRARGAWPDGAPGEVGVDHEARDCLRRPRRRRGRDPRPRRARRPARLDRAPPARPRVRSRFRSRPADRAAGQAAHLLERRLRDPRRVARGARLDGLRGVPRERRARARGRQGDRTRGHRSGRASSGRSTTWRRSRTRSSPRPSSRRRPSPRRRRSRSPGWSVSFRASAARTHPTGASASSSGTRSLPTGPARATRPPRTGTSAAPARSSGSTPRQTSRSSASPISSSETGPWKPGRPSPTRCSRSRAAELVAYATGLMSSSKAWRSQLATIAGVIACSDSPNGVQPVERLPGAHQAPSRGAEHALDHDPEARAVLVRREDRLAGRELPPDHVLGEAPQSLAGDPREHLDAGELVDGGS